MHPTTAKKIEVEAGSTVKISFDGVNGEAVVKLDDTISTGVVLVPRSMGIAIREPVTAKVKIIMDWTIWLEWILKGFILCLILLTGFAYLTLYERRALARMQVRVGPNRAGPQGLLQPIADAVKLIFKEELTPGRVYKVVFILAPVLTVVPSLSLRLSFHWELPSICLGARSFVRCRHQCWHVLYLMSIASIAVYGIVLAGWSSNNKYAMLGGMRSSAQMISYELSLGFAL
jgi:NADH-quinone oxidoreductase subunit H